MIVCGRICIRLGVTGVMKGVDGIEPMKVKGYKPSETFEDEMNGS